MYPKRRAKLIGKVLKEKKGRDIILLNLSRLTDLTNYFVITTATSTPHMEALIYELEKKIGPPWHKEGETKSGWVVLDYVDVVVHIFTEKTRTYYELERLWSDAPMEEVREEEE